MKNKNGNMTRLIKDIVGSFVVTCIIGAMLFVVLRATMKNQETAKKCAGEITNCSTQCLPSKT